MSAILYYLDLLMSRLLLSHILNSTLPVLGRSGLLVRNVLVSGEVSLSLMLTHCSVSLSHLIAIITICGFQTCKI